jgi:hypothetical protein
LSPAVGAAIEGDGLGRDCAHRAARPEDEGTAVVWAHCANLGMNTEQLASLPPKGVGLGTEPVEDGEGIVVDAISFGAVAIRTRGSLRIKGCEPDRPLAQTQPAACGSRPAGSV